MKTYLVVILGLTGITFASCADDQESKKTSQPKIESKSKPPSSFPDTLRIDSRSAVFYSPDSLQLEKIKTVTANNVYESSMHEYFYQIRYVRGTLLKTWPDVKIVDAKNVRYLQFVKTDHAIETIDLNTKNDAYGLFVFDPAKSPLQIELTNAETEIGFYLPTTKELKKNK